ncbi:MAG: hypothetical protein WBE75_00340 [Candidatus Omnitrophota bacterium]
MKIRIEEESLELIRKRKLLEAWQQYITEGYEWTLWFNVSFRIPTSDKVAKKRFKWFLKYLNTENELYVPNFVICWVFYERQDTSNGVHIHALIDRIDSKHSEVIQAKARKYFGEMSKVEPYDPFRGASYYLAGKINTSRLVACERYVISSKTRNISLSITD